MCWEVIWVLGFGERSEFFVEGLIAVVCLRWAEGRKR